MADGLKRILVVDDDDNIRGMVSKMLSRMGYEVLSTNSGDRGLNLFMKNQLDLVITDFDMPRMDGCSLASHIKKNSPNMLVILMTGNGENDILEKFPHIPADRILFKPFSYEEFENAIKKR